MSILECPHSSRPLGRRVVLVIEDDADSRESLQLLLTAMLGQEVYATHSGHAGVAMAVDLRADLVFADIGLPDLDGYRVAEALRAKLGETVRLVALSGYDARPVERFFDAHLLKPVRPEQLAKQLELITAR